MREEEGEEKGKRQRERGIVGGTKQRRRLENKVGKRKEGRMNETEPGMER